MIIDLVLEGSLEEPVAQKIVTFCGHEVGNSFGKNGARYIEGSAHKFHDITKTGKAVFVLTDYADTGCGCIVAACNKYLFSHIPSPDRRFLLRFAVYELESWLLADIDGISNFLAISKTHLPKNPDTVHDPKQFLVNLARKSRKNVIKKAIVPSKRHGGVVGPYYNPTMQQFVEDIWDIQTALTNSPSLEHCVSRLQTL